MRDYNPHILKATRKAKQVEAGEEFKADEIGNILFARTVARAFSPNRSQKNAYRNRIERRRRK